jgi:hypothetical protein
MYLHDLVVVVPVPLTIIPILHGRSVVPSNHVALMLCYGIESVDWRVSLGTTYEIRKIQFFNRKHNFGVYFASSFRVLEAFNVDDEYIRQFP